MRRLGRKVPIDWHRSRLVACVVLMLGLALSVGAHCYATESAAAATEPAAAATACPPTQPLPGAAMPSPAPASPVSASGPYRPASGEIVACVGTQPISGATFSHWATVAERSSGRTRRVPGIEPDRGQMLQVMGFLISTYWVIGEAADLHVLASPAEVRHRFDRLRREQFHKPGAFEAFLRQTGERVEDLLLRVRLQMLSSRIQRHVLGSDGGSHQQQGRLSRFISRFRHKWEARTYCEPVYKTIDCGHVGSSL
jgi:hypothetical protein